MTGPMRRDSSWVRHAFMVRKEDLALVDFQNQSFSSASLKFTDTTPGGNFAINPPPQFTNHADIKQASKFSKSRGMGRYYSEAIDDNSQIIHLRMGVPKFNSLTTFFTGFYNTGAGQLARTGRSTSAFYDLGKAAGFVVSLMAWQLLAVHMLGVGYRFFAQKPASKFYYSKPAMPLYWNAVTTMFNQIAVNLGAVPRVLSGEEVYKNDVKFDKDSMSAMARALPNEFKFTEGGTIDIYALATRAQRLARQRYLSAEQRLSASSNEELSRQVKEILSENLEDKPPSLENYLKKWLAAQAASPNPNDGKEGKSAVTEELSNVLDDGWWQFLKAELDDGGAFASFRVNYTGSVSDSFSNTVGPSELANKINSMSSSARSTRFDMANGNVGDGIIAGTLEAAAGAVKDFVSGIGAAFEISGLAALGGSAFVDIPQHWQTSTASLGRTSYTMHLTSPYGNPISQLLNIHLPLCMILAAALPLSTGKQSYTSPFLVEIYDQGRCQSRLAMIDSVQITRGTGNMGFSPDGKVMAIDVTFSVVDLSTVMHMPIAEGFSMTQALVGAVAGAAVGPVTSAVGAAVANGIFDEDTIFSDYMATLAGMGLADQIYSFRKLKLNVTKQMVNFKSWTSSAHFMARARDTFVGDAWSAFFKGVQR